MATTKNITMKQFNGTDYDILYPKTVYNQVSGVAPAGYGLGGGATNIDNLNDAVNNGWYLTAGTVSNGPKESIYGWMLVSSRSGSGGMIRQDFWEAMTNPTHYVRYAVNGEFKEWEYVNPPLQLDVEYRTTERYLGKPVYVRMINAGAFPPSGHKSVSISLNNLQQIIRATGSFKNSTRIPWGYDGDHLQEFYIENTQIILYALNPGFTGDAYISVYYIKTTD